MENIITEKPTETSQFPWLSKLFSNLRGDLTGGFTAAIVALPLALAFAVASGVEPKAGLYTAILAGIVAAILGGSPVQITGPTGAMAVILVGIVTQYGIEKVWLAGVMAGLIQVGLGVAKLGQVVKFIPPNMDTTGLVALEDIYYDLKRHDCRLMLTGLQPQVREILERSELLQKIGEENCFETTTQAICSLHPDLPECSLSLRTKTELVELSEV